MMIRFCLTISFQTISLISPGMLKGLRKMFHFDSSSSSERIRKASPSTTIITAEAFPFFTTVERQKPSDDTSSTSTIMCRIMGIIGKLIRAHQAMPAKGKSSRKTRKRIIT